MRVKITIEGQTPLMCNCYTAKAALAATDGTAAAQQQGDRGTPREIAESKLYIDSDGKCCIPQPNLLGCIADGGYWHKIGKKQVTTKTESLVYAACDVLGLSIPIEHKQPWSVDARPIVIPSTKGRILTYRPRFDDWRLTFEMELRVEIIGPKLMRAILDDAGMRAGIGDFRPIRKGPFGRFKVIRWAEMPVQLQAREAA